jgi:hypothetical protein
MINYYVLKKEVYKQMLYKYRATNLKNKLFEKKTLQIPQNK